MKRLLIIFNIILAVNILNGQDPQPSFILTAPEPPDQTRDYQASEFIKLLPAFHADPNSGKFVRARIDPLMVFPPTTGKYGGPNPGDDGVVGTLPGILSVSPLGGALYSIPIEVPPGTGGMTPSISLAYNSHSGNGILGYGWSIGGLSSISRASTSIYHEGYIDGIDFDENDKLALDGQRLIPINGNAEYRTEIETFSQILPKNIVNGWPTWFEVRTKDGQIIEYGRTADSRIEASGRQDVLFWLINRISDRKGNYIDFIYVEENGYGKISQILYTGNSATLLQPYHEIKFNYRGNKPDPIRKFISGSQILINTLLASIELKYQSNLIRSYDLEYSTDYYVTHLNNITLNDYIGNHFNSTLFTWTDTQHAQCLEQVSSSTDADVTQFFLDMNGDGKTDIVELYYIMVEGVPGYTDWKFRIREDGMFSQPVNITADIDNWLFMLLDGDFNGDGLQDIARFINSSKEGISMKLDLLLISTGINFDSYIINCPWFSFDEKLDVNKGDFNGDGIDEIIITQKTKNISGGNNTTIYSLVNNTLEVIFETRIEYGNTNHDKANFLVADFTADGKSDILSTAEFEGTPHNCEFYIYETNEAFNGLTTLCNGGYPNNWHHIRLADFNGDGIADIATYAFENPEFNWEFSIFNGRDQFNPYIDVPENMWEFNPENPTVQLNYKFEFSDYNGDGITDIAQFHDRPDYIVEYDIFYHNGSAFEQFSGQFEGDGISIGPVPVGSNGSNYIMHKRFYDAHDFTGDGKADFYHYRYNEILDRVYFFELRTPYNAVTSFTNGFGATSRVNYKSLTSSEVYTKGTNASYPFVDIQPAMHVVSDIVTDNGNGETFKTEYTYAGAKMHTKGKGFLGYDKITVIAEPNTNHEGKTETYFSFNPDHYFPFLDSSHTYYLTPNRELTRISSTYHEVPIKVDFGGNRIFYYTPVSINKHFHTGDQASSYIRTVRSEQIYYDGNDTQYGNVSLTKIYADENEYELSDPADLYDHSTIATYNYDYTKVDQWLISRLVSASTASHSKLDPTESTDRHLTQFVYENNSPLVLKQIVKPNNSVPHTIEREFERDAYGNITRDILSAPYWTPSINNRMVEYSYSSDYQYRFITEKKQVISGKQFSESYSYYPEYGLPSTHTDINSLMTTYFYDSFGRLVKTVLPDQVELHNVLRWSMDMPHNPARGLLMTWTCRSGDQARTEFFDKLSRKLLSVGKDFNGNEVFIQKEYNDLGYLLKESAPYFRTEEKLWTNYQYLTDGKIKTIISPVNNLVFNYSGRYQSVENLNTGITTVKAYDALGNMIIAADQGGIIFYDYLSSGNLHQVHYNNQTTTMTYDAAGSQSMLDDPDAGRMNYLFNPFGDLIKQEDARHNIYQMNYDEIGRIKEKREINQSHLTYYLYDENDHSKGKPSWEVNTWNGMSTHYVYNHLSRLVQKTEVIDYENYNFNYTYDVFGNVKSETWPDGFSIEYRYKNGYPGKVVEPITELTVWELNELTSKGMIKQSTLGNHLTTIRSYTPTGYLTDIQTGQVQRLGYSFDEFTGNLTWRKDLLIPGTLQEDFTYDNYLKNRLETWQVQEKTLYAIDYENNGNFNSKTDVGTEMLYGPQPCIYSFAGPNALTKVNGPDATFLDASRDCQEIIYTAFNKTQQVTNMKMIEGYPDVYSLHIDYGPDENRRKTNLTHNGNPATEKIFVNGSYEIETDDLDNSRTLHYITGGDGLCAVYITENENPAGNIFYVLKDHLGSIYAITDGQGEIVNYSGQKQVYSFDPWGRRRNPEDWTFNNVPDHFLLDRGFTLHEHLGELGLINMNGRLYDPWLGRFCAPDNFVQMPDYSQNMNRYSYVWNNPLTYTDPSGEIVWTPIVIGAAIGAYMGGTMANGTNNPAQWDYSSGRTWGYMAGGAIVGAASGYVGGAIATSGMPMANTAGIAGASFVNSVGTHIYTGGQTDVSVSFGVASYNFGTNEWGYLGKRGNSTLENIGYGFGELANLGDAFSLFSGGGQNVKVNSASTKDGNEWWGHSSITDENGSSLVSVGPDGQVQKAASLSETWRNSIKGADTDWSTYLGKKGTWSVELNNVSTTAISKYASGVSRWDLLLNSCVGHTSRALWTAGVPNVYAFHPHILNLQLAIRQIGIYSSPYLYQIR